eukprot:342197-Chlamydomonas_euryale.AAC.3
MAIFCAWFDTLMLVFFIIHIPVRRDSLGGRYLGSGGCGASSCPGAGSGARATDGGGARRGRAAADSAERHATAGA